jgi:hypothetical protein
MNMGPFIPGACAVINDARCSAPLRNAGLSSQDLIYPSLFQLVRKGRVPN